MTEKRELLAKAEETFFASGVAGWSGDVQPIELPDLPGSRLIVWADGDWPDWSVRDLYFVTDHSQQSWGQTIIYYKDKDQSIWLPIWRMIYWGEYPEEAIPHFVDHNSFSKFSGKEFVIDNDTNQTLGWHQYCGVSLL